VRKIKRKNSPIGKRVKIPHDPTGVTLRSHHGRVIRYDDKDLGYVIVLLDSPALYHANLGKQEKIEEIVEDEENLIFL